MAPSDRDDVVVVFDRRRDFGTDIVKLRVLRVPCSEKFPNGVKYAYHYAEKGADVPYLRYDNHHGVHERHEGEHVEEVEFPGYETLLRQFAREIPVHLQLHR
ncbi:toxin-antitoxin system TumE family protein [Halorussus pelagicus]|uniref:toxin-antitoxin system TumE family protein n=1 Tax=Halorussus pelagicus TaxID=2505977 RepID=UPI000FFBE960|nr:DUF6516 family protein [Halorussus pelagicus]